jgi:hypothetical protein
MVALFITMTNDSFDTLGQWESVLAEIVDRYIFLSVKGKGKVPVLN